MTTLNEFYVPSPQSATVTANTQQVTIANIIILNISRVASRET